MTVELEKVREKLKEVVDPEFERPIVDRNLIDDVKAEGSTVTVVYHLTVPFCPFVFATHIGRDIRERVKQSRASRRWSSRSRITSRLRR